MIFPMNPLHRCIRLLFALSISALSLKAANEAAAGLPPDLALRQAILGSWVYEKNVGIASVAVYTTYRDDGTATELLRMKIVLKKATGVWTEYRWHIENGDLHLLPVRSRTNSDDTRADMEETVRQLVRVDSTELFFRRKGKERTDRRTTVPDDIRKMTAELSK